MSRFEAKFPHLPRAPLPGDCPIKPQGGEEGVYEGLPRKSPAPRRVVLRKDRWVHRKKAAGPKGLSRKQGRRKRRHREAEQTLPEGLPKEGERTGAHLRDGRYQWLHRKRAAGPEGLPRKRAENNGDTNGILHGRDRHGYQKHRRIVSRIPRVRRTLPSGYGMRVRSGRSDRSLRRGPVRLQAVVPDSSSGRGHSFHRGLRPPADGRGIRNYWKKLEERNG